MSFQPRAQGPGLHVGGGYFKWMEGREWHEGRDVMIGLSGGASGTWWALGD